MRQGVNTQLLYVIVPVSSSRLGCYFTNWSQYRNGAGKFEPSDIDPDLCTHLIYAFAGFNEENQLVITDWTDVFRYQAFNALKERCEQDNTVALHSHRVLFEQSTDFFACDCLGTDF